MEAATCSMVQAESCGNTIAEPYSVSLNTTLESKYKSEILRMKKSTVWLKTLCFIDHKKHEDENVSTEEIL
jgi:hypothetical protein